MDILFRLPTAVIGIRIGERLVGSFQCCSVPNTWIINFVACPQAIAHTN